MFKKYTPEQEERYNRIEKKISELFWGLVAVAMIIAMVVYGPYVP
ncbi:hypothetical protein ACT8ZT_20615 [Cohnella sp. M.A.Huq-80]